MTMSQTDLAHQLDELAKEYGNRFLLEAAPDDKLPEHGMRAVDALRLIGEELVLDGIPMRNLATFVTTWMEPEAQRIIAENLHRNFIDHAEYPQTAEIEQRCIRMIASEEPCVLVPVVSPGAWNSSASMRTQRCWISNVLGYSAWSMKLR